MALPESRSQGAAVP